VGRSTSLTVGRPTYPKEKTMSPNIKDALKGAVRSFLFAFAALAIPAALDVLRSITAWAAEHGQAPLPNWHNESFIFVNALVAGLVAAVTFLVRLIENSTGKTFLRSPSVTPAPYAGD
jgi:cytochrome c biogenesis protein CcdA